ncbi:hypothetical protein EPN87_02125 [archaeon]|nr:MAG: hypothetical protein EPN87_02125 [archaeon]
MKFGLDKNELKIFHRLNTPRKIQDFLNGLKINFEEHGDTLMSPRRILAEGKAHCMEGALFAAAVLSFHGHMPLLMDIKTSPSDYEHVVALFRQHGHWGAISKTNHAMLRFREPVYKTVRELAMSFFHEYFLDNGKKTMRSFSKPFSLAPFKGWMTSEKDLWEIYDALDSSPHVQILSKGMIAGLRAADNIEIDAGKLVQYKP